MTIDPQDISPITLDWKTYSAVMTDRYNDGRRETRTIIVSRLRDKFEETDENDPVWVGLQVALDVAIEAR
jgi:hypothetical protein